MSNSKELSSDSVILLDFTMEEDDSSAVFLDFTVDSEPEESFVSLDYSEADSDEFSHCQETTVHPPSQPHSPSQKTSTPISQLQGASTPIKSRSLTSLNRKRTSTPRNSHTRKKQCLDRSSLTCKSFN